MAIRTGTFGATGSSKILPGNKEGTMGVSIWGTWSGTVLLEWSFDGGANWNTIDTYTSNENVVVASPSEDVIYRLRCSVYSSGTVEYGLAS